MLHADCIQLVSPSWCCQRGVGKNVVRRGFPQERPAGHRQNSHLGRSANEPLFSGSQLKDLVPMLQQDRHAGICLRPLGYCPRVCIHLVRKAVS